MNEDIIKKIEVLSKKGEALFSQSKFEDAKEKYFEALELIPDPLQNYRESTWLLVAIGDSHFKLGNFEKCFKCFYNAAQCPDGLGNPFIHLRLGQMYFEMGDHYKSVDELMRAYMGGGFDILLEDDPKYLEFFKSKVDLGMDK